MCGRYKMDAEERELRKRFKNLLASDEYFDIHGYKKRREIFPGTPIMTVNNEREMQEIHWTIEQKFGGKSFRVINAMAETIDQKPMFKKAFSTDRILVPATGLYEWQVQPDKSKIKYEISFDEELFAFAGIARDCYIKDEKKRCGVIITTRPNETFKLIHNSKMRQAVVIRADKYDDWLDPSTPLEHLKHLMEPLPDSATTYRVADKMPPDEPDKDEDKDAPSLFD